MERIANGTYLQDYFFGRMYDEFFSPQYAKNSHLLVFGDHSFPIEIHPGNRYNLNGAFQENFVTSMAFLPAEQVVTREGYRVGTAVASLRSLLDIVPTVLETYGVRQNNYYGKSFFKDLVVAGDSGSDPRCVVSVQPYSGGTIAVINYPMKYMYGLRTGMLTVFDLAHDPTEMSPRRAGQIKAEDLNVLEDCLRSLKPNSTGSP
jgi:hypothetical protein